MLAHKPSAYILVVNGKLQPTVKVLFDLGFFLLSRTFHWSFIFRLLFPEHFQIANELVGCCWLADFSQMNRDRGETVVNQSDLCCWPWLIIHRGRLMWESSIWPNGLAEIKTIGGNEKIRGGKRRKKTDSSQGWGNDYLRGKDPIFNGRANRGCP